MSIKMCSILFALSLLVGCATNTKTQEFNPTQVVPICEDGVTYLANPRYLVLPIDENGNTIPCVDPTYS